METRPTEEKKLTKTELLTLINQYGYDVVMTSEEKRALYFYFREYNIGTERIKSIFNGAKKFVIANAKHSGRIYPSDVKPLIMNICTTLDSSLFEQFDKLDKQLKKYYREQDLDYPRGLDTVLKFCHKRAKELTIAENNELSDFSEKAYDFMLTFASLYHSLATNLGELSNQNSNKGENGAFLSVIDYLLTQRLLSLTNVKSLTMNKVKEFDGFLKSLKAEGGVEFSERFSEADIYELLDSTSSILTHVSREKLNGTRAVIKNFVAEIIKQGKARGEDIELLNKFSTKQFFLEFGSGLTLQPENLQDTCRLMLGEKVSDIIAKRESKKYAKNEDFRMSLRETFPDLHIVNLDLKKQARILFDTRSVLMHMNAHTIFEEANVLTNTAYEALGFMPCEDIREKVGKLKQVGFDVNTMFTGDNIYTLFNLGVHVTKLRKQSDLTNQMSLNIKLLNNYVAPSVIFKIFQENVNFLMQDSELMRKNLEKIVKSSKNSEDFKKKFKELVETKIVLDYSSEGGSDKTSKRAKKGSRSTVIDAEFNPDIQIEEANLSEQLLKRFKSENLAKSAQNKKVEQIQSDVQKVVETRHAKAKPILTEDALCSMIEHEFAGLSLFCTDRNADLTCYGNCLATKIQMMLKGQNSLVGTRAQFYNFKMQVATYLNLIFSKEDFKSILKFNQDFTSLNQNLEQMIETLGEDISSLKEELKTSHDEAKTHKQDTANYIKKVQEEVSQVLASHGLEFNSTIKAEIKKQTETDEKRKAKVRQQKTYNSEIYSEGEHMSIVQRMLVELQQSISHSSVKNKLMKNLEQQLSVITDEYKDLKKQLADKQAVFDKKSKEMKERFLVEKRSKITSPFIVRCQKELDSLEEQINTLKQSEQSLLSKIADLKQKSEEIHI